MIPIVATISGEAEVQERFRKSADKLRQAVEDALFRVADETAQRASDLAPRRTGKLASNVKFAQTLSTADAIRIIVRPEIRAAFYGLFHETGVDTIGRVPKPYLRRIAHGRAGSEGGAIVNESLAARFAKIRKRFRSRGGLDPGMAYGQTGGMEVVTNTKGRHIHVSQSPFMAPARDFANDRTVDRVKEAVARALET